MIRGTLTASTVRRANFMAGWSSTPRSRPCRVRWRPSGPNRRCSRVMR